MKQQGFLPVIKFKVNKYQEIMYNGFFWFHGQSAHNLFIAVV